MSLKNVARCQTAADVVYRRLRLGENALAVHRDQCRPGRCPGCFDHRLVTPSTNDAIRASLETRRPSGVPSMGYGSGSRLVANLELTRRGRRQLSKVNYRSSIWRLCRWLGRSVRQILAEYSGGILTE
jgi:hypothetical protein